MVRAVAMRRVLARRRVVPDGMMGADMVSARVVRRGAVAPNSAKCHDAESSGAEHERGGIQIDRHVSENTTARTRGCVRGS